ncbi:hypothetical protein KA183_11940 [bacterium]|nr:hypothetical protein [bacterium]QQR57084.1 MAG: hypothetical protein IPG59_19170 [Candidatus Melainabacteria bacterium]
MNRKSLAAISIFLLHGCSLSPPALSGNVNHDQAGVKVGMSGIDVFVYSKKQVNETITALNNIDHAMPQASLLFPKLFDTDYIAKTVTGPQSGKFKFDQLKEGDYVVAVEAHTSVKAPTIYWLIPIHIEEGKAQKIELSDKNTVFTYNSFAKLEP